MKKIAKKIVHRVKFFVCEIRNRKLHIEIVKIFSDNSTKSEKYILNSAIVEKLTRANSQKEFSALVNNEFVKVAKLDAQAKKQQLVENTYYCASRNYIALATNRLEFAEVAFRQRHEATKTLRKVVKAKKAKRAKKVAVKK